MKRLFAGALAVVAVIGLGLLATDSASANHAAAPDEITISTVGSPVAPVGGTVHVALAVTTSTTPHKGIQWELAYGFNLSHVSSTYNCTNPGGINYPSETDTGPTESVLIPATVKNLGGGSNCASLSGPFAGAAMTGTFVDVILHCDAAGQTFISMRPATEAANAANDPLFGTSLLDSTGAYITTTLENQFPIPGFGSQAAVGVACVAPVDISITKSGPATANIGDAGSYTLTVNNPSASAQTVNVSDDIPAGVTATAATAPCVLGDPVVCTGVAVPAAGSTVLTIDVTFDTCGQKLDTASAQLVDPTPPSVTDPDPLNNTAAASTDVDCPGLTITKSVDDTTVTIGDSVTYSYVVCNDAGSTATNVAVNDSNLGLIGTIPSIAGGACAPALVNGPVLMPAVGVVCNTATAQSDNGSNVALSNEVCVTVASAFDTTLNGFAKDGDPSDADTDNTVNLWICKPAGFPNPFEGLAPDGTLCNGLTIGEILNIGPDTDTCNDDDDGDGAPCAGDPSQPPAPYQDQGDGCLNVATNYIPGQTDVDCDTGEGGINGTGEGGEGIGAFELQIKYDHKLFQQPVATCEQGPFGDRSVQPQVTVITENWTLFGCVSKSHPPALGLPETVCDGLDTDVDGVVDDGCGNPFVPGSDGFSGYAMFVHLTIQPDLFSRIRPTKDNGVVTDLLDENCEVADAFGQPWPGSVQGGLQPDCRDLTVTIRMLEGDIDLDCDVDIVDDQQMAFRYGSFFGSLLYNRFFDLEPNIAPDFDVDIKDLQTVFGRNGSTCDAPIPDQNPQSQVPDP